MCGIAGIANTSREGVDAQEIHAMCQTIVHRGPDDEGILVKDGVGLGMRRLSIIDLAGGHQPIFNEDRSVAIVFNGEIYNFQELRRELDAKGHRFSTNSDTEVIVHLYEEHGAECVKKLRGMFAFALYDERRRRLLLARDRLGIKPLHYALNEGRLLFGSEIKAILAAAPELNEIDPRAVLQYFYFGYIPDPLTAFTSIRKLPPGHILEFEQGKISIRQYWDLPQYGTDAPRSEEECLEQLEQLLAEAVKIRLISDVPLGALLSGGADSSLVVALMARAASGPVKTFSIGFRQADFDEAPYARKVAERFATEHHELILEPDIVQTVETLTRLLEEPFGDSSMLPTYYVCRLARQHVTVALSGDGGDEAFAGYDRYRIHLRDRAYGWVPEVGRKLYRNYLHRLVPYSVPGRNLAYSVSLPWSERYIEGVSLKPFQREMKLLANDFTRLGDGGNDPMKIMRDYVEAAPAKDPLDRLLYLDTKTYLAGDILTKVDRMSMAVSLEARVPILDHIFLEYVTGLPSDWKLHGRTQKYIFRKLAERVGVPKEVLNRPKRGFALPLVHWMRHELKDLIVTTLTESRTMQRGYFDAKGVHRMLDEHFRERRDHSARIWRLLMAELWHRNFVEGLPARGPQAVTSSVGEGL
ncbi:MAG TPA: asparagine synthase (glutamine-hydrolyzing) [Candidatus Sulfotelmatobacter sp.]|nr:asparagine synthase (glutamine-hydrolyzing) [Candidatus Sulfotelmatobacter sp.]